MLMVNKNMELNELFYRYTEFKERILELWRAL